MIHINTIDLVIPNLPSPDLAEELGRRKLAPPCCCAAWPLRLTIALDDAGYAWRCAGCASLPQKCSCTRVPHVAGGEKDAYYSGETSRPETAENADNQGVSYAGGV